MLRTKLVIIGDICVGKTSLINRFAEQKFNVSEGPTIGVDFQNLSVEVDGLSYITVQAWDMNCAGSAMTRQKLYQNMDVFNVVFSVVNPKTFRNVEKYWIPEIRGCCPNNPILLVGNMIDRRHDAWNQITPEMGEKLAYKINAIKYVECSCKTGLGVSNAFQQSAREGRRCRRIKEAIENPKEFRKNLNESEKFKTCSTIKTHFSDVIDPPVVHYH